MAKADLTAEYLREFFTYNERTGEFKYRNHPETKPSKIGTAPGVVGPSGYKTICILGKAHRANRLAWLYVYGKHPEALVDHIDGNRLNNAIANLRDVSTTVNGQNMRSATKRSTSGYLGVSAAPRGKWIASISVFGKYKYIGIFKTPIEAHHAYVAAKRVLHEGCTI